MIIHKIGKPMNTTDNITFIQSVLDFAGIEHRDMIIIIFMIIVATLAYVSRKWYTIATKCDGIDCAKVKTAVEKAASMDKKLHSMELMVVEMKIESHKAHTQLKADLDRFDRYLEELKRNSTELHGILIGGARNSSESTRRRIIHDDS